MIIKSHMKRYGWWLRAKVTHDPELAVAYLRGAEKWADLIEASWLAEEEFGAVAQAAHTETLGEFSTFAFHQDPCDFLVEYLKETWEFGERLSEWYESLRR